MKIAGSKLLWIITLAGAAVGWFGADVLLGYSAPPTFTFIICPTIFVVYPLFAMLLDLDDRIWWPLLNIGNALLYAFMANWLLRLVRRKVSN
jgi:hypothetical protein